MPTPTLALALAIRVGLQRREIQGLQGPRLQCELGLELLLDLGRELVISVQGNAPDRGLEAACTCFRDSAQLFGELRARDIGISLDPFQLSAEPGLDLG